MGKQIAIILLLVGGLVHAVPPLSAFLTGLTGGTPIIQIVVGVASVLVGLKCLTGCKSECKSS